MRESEIKRKTAETDISLSLCVDGTGKAEISTGIGFLDHMLTLFARHGRFDLCITCKGDICVDDHHSTEDIGIALGQALRQALGDKKGICRYGDIILPMDEALILASVDISGRGMLCLSAEFRTEKIGTFDTELVEEFFQAFAANAGITLHIRQLDGRNSHHIAEGMFKAVARAMRKAVSIDEAARDEIPSTKGVL
ncbi:MAG: imidazoleglycerol-phosphate dehydratase HisB [Spirochaetales bacterium]|nr:imidazoleglycerol-phosphate dehydratase HisB [Spirochaetales bacterium]MBQ3698086.1 imidazoleglycerol-phosphate dehydratase HisB [Spirochaetales bacterium]MBQ6124337.1 imidazoleglycerol-phosphate dehydratase HisB [Spirochaetales bacterium]MBQ7728717.1 imidazoleglycerol-phosphate dehydratase HisB [Spirochaetales bacterium]